MEQNPNTIAEKIIKKIEEEHVAPLGKWRFVLRNNSFWALWALSVLIGACTIAATIFVCMNAGWRYQAITHDSFFQFFFDVMPLFWVISFSLMILLGYYNVRHTSRGYRFSFYLVIVASVMASFIGGTVLYAIGIGKDIDDFRKPLPFVHSITEIEENRWNNADRGLFSGTVIYFDPLEESLVLRLISGEDKVFSTGELDDLDASKLLIDSHIRIIGGSDTGNGNFTIACAVIPWEAGSPPNQILRLERKADLTRNNVCKGIHSYQKYLETLNID